MDTMKGIHLTDQIAGERTKLTDKHTSEKCVRLTIQD